MSYQTFGRSFNDAPIVLVNHALTGNSEVIGENGWWNDLKETMETDKHCDYGSIARFDPPSEHMGGLGNATSKFGGDTAAGDSS